MPRLLTLCAAALALCALAGCGGKSSADSTSESTPATTTAASTETDTATTPAATTPAGAKDLTDPSKLTAKAPAEYDVVFTTTKGKFTAEVHRDWSPLGADRFYNLVQNGFYDGVRFFRVVPGFVVQFGIHPTPKIAQAWKDANIDDDPVTQSNTAGTMTFATAGPGTRTTQIFINLANNASLDAQGFSPFAKVISGMDTVAKLYSGYGDEPTSAQEAMTNLGDAYLKKSFPKLDRIITARVSQ